MLQAQPLPVMERPKPNKEKSKAKDDSGGKAIRVSKSDKTQKKTQYVSCPSERAGPYNTLALLLTLSPVD